jgi:RND family efflux transporter MFP subunit
MVSTSIPPNSAGAKSSVDPLAKLRIERAPPPARRSWIQQLFRGVFFLVVLFGCLAAGLVLAGRNGWIAAGAGWLDVPEMIQSRMEVRFASVSVESGRAAEAVVVATGYLESRRQAKIGARAPGRIEVVHVEEGSKVEAAQVLAVLEHADLDASLAAAEAVLARSKAELGEQQVQIDQSRRAFERAEKLRGGNGVSDAEYDQAKFSYEGAVARRVSLEAAVALADARVREAQQMKANMFIVAPFRGTVISKDAEVGESILPGGMGEASGRGSVVTVADLEHLEVECDVKEDFINRVSSGQSAEVAVDAVPDRRYAGRVRKIIPMGDRARATIKVKVAITEVDDRLFPEMSATVYFLPDQPAALDPSALAAQRRVFCESEAIQSDAAGSYVWTMDNEARLRRMNVTTGTARDDRTEVTNGLVGGEQVVIAPPGAREGQLVRVSP